MKTLLKGKLAKDPGRLAEITVNYETGRADFSGLKKGTRLRQAANVFVMSYTWWFVKHSIIVVLPIFLLGALASHFHWDLFNQYINVILSKGVQLLLLPPLLATLTQASWKDLDESMHLHNALRSVKGEKRSKIIVTEIYNKELVIPNIGNLIVEYDAKGEFSEYLKLVEIKEEPKTVLFNKQVKAKNFIKNDSDDDVLIWNAHFHFSKIPRDGQLRIEWI